MFFLGGVVLIAAIALGNQMGNRVLRQVTGAASVTFPNLLATPNPGETHLPNEATWKKVQVLSVASDPAFPDPRVTPEPTPTARPKPSYIPTPQPPTPEPGPTVPYTSPPLLLPLVTHAPGETSPEEPGRQASPAGAPGSQQPANVGRGGAPPGTVPPLPTPVSGN